MVSFHTLLPGKRVYLRDILAGQALDLDVEVAAMPEFLRMPPPPPTAGENTKNVRSVPTSVAASQAVDNLA